MTKDLPDATSRFLLRENSERDVREGGHTNSTLTAYIPVDPVLLVGGMYIPEEEALMGLPSAMATCLDIVLGGT